MPEVSPTQSRPDRFAGMWVAAVGYSARALAQAAVACRHKVVVIDHFCDQDTRELANAVLRVANWGQPSRDHFSSMLAFLEGQPGATSVRQTGLEPIILLGGGTENWPELIDQLGRRFRILGPNSKQIQQLRSLDFWRKASQQTGVRFPQSLPRPDAETSSNFSWLWKSMGGSGGIHVRRATPLECTQSTHQPTAETRTGEPSRYLQLEIPGRNLGVTCILGEPNAAHDACYLVGATESLTSQDWPAPTEFIYRGSWGPIRLSDAHRSAILRLARSVQSQSGLIGWLQMDFIEDARGQLWLLEMNPRWTAGMEILSLAGRNPVGAHTAAWGHGLLPGGGAIQSVQDWSSDRRYVKAVLYAERDLPITNELLKRIYGLPRESFADLPAQDLLDSQIAAGNPILTLKASTASAGEDDTKIGARLRELLGRQRALVCKLLNTC